VPAKVPSGTIFISTSSVFCLSDSSFFGFVLILAGFVGFTAEQKADRLVLLVIAGIIGAATSDGFMFFYNSCALSLGRFEIIAGWNGPSMEHGLPLGCCAKAKKVFDVRDIHEWSSLRNKGV
jgi:hypothetical protein